MAEKKSKSDRDIITEAVLAASNKRLDTMTGAEIKASADRMAAQEKQFSSRYAPGDQAYDWGIEQWERERKDAEWMNPKYPKIFPLMAPAPPKGREQDYGPWQEGRPLAARWGDPGPYPYEGTDVMWPMDRPPPTVARPKEGPGSDMPTVDPRDVHRSLMGTHPPEESVILPSGKLNNEEVRRDIEAYRRMKEAYGPAEEILKGEAKKPKRKK